MQKRNYSTREYEPYTIPSGWLCPAGSDNMEQIINCTSCGVELEYGRTLTSRTIHTDIGLGYPVCSTCYSVELTDAKKFAE